MRVLSNGFRDSEGHIEGGSACVSVARRIDRKPALFTTMSRRRCSPAWAPSAGPFRASDTGTQNLAIIFNTTLSNDLQSAGIFEMVSRSFFPVSVPGAPQEVLLVLDATVGQNGVIRVSRTSPGVDRGCAGREIPPTRVGGAQEIIAA